MADFIIDDSTPDHVLFDGTYGRGLIATTLAGGYCAAAGAEPFPQELVIPRADWQAMIAEQEEKKSRIPDFCDLMGIKVKDQQQTNFCWANSPVHCLEILRAMEGEDYVSLSPASVAAQLTHYRNVGGMGIDALRFLASHGATPSDLWPDNAIARQYATPDAATSASRYRFDKWWELDHRDLDQLMSCLLRGIPVSAGYNWWGHQVTPVAARWIDNAIAIEFDNSWGVAYGNNGRGVLQGRRMLPDDAVAPRTAIAA